MPSLWSRDKSWRNRDRRPAWSCFSVIIDEIGLRRFNADRTRSWLIFWDDIDEIETYKADLFIYDMICLSFHTSEGWHEVQEQDVGFPELMNVLRSRFPSIPEDWYGVVMHPAFEANARTLWTGK